MKNKLKALYFLFFLFATGAAMSQKGSTVVSPGKNEIHIGYGWNTVQEMQALFTDIFANDTQTSGAGAFSLGYRYHLNNKWAAGVTGVIENIRVSGKNAADNYSCKTYAVLADVHYYYFQKPLLQLYSGVYAGYGSFKTNKQPGDNFNTVAFHATAVGLRAGKKIGIFGEAGFGYRGIINVGISARL